MSNVLILNINKNRGDKIKLNSKLYFKCIKDPNYPCRLYGEGYNYELITITPFEINEFVIKEKEWHLNIIKQYQDIFNLLNDLIEYSPKLMYTYWGNNELPNISEKFIVPNLQDTNFDLILNCEYNIN